MLECVVNISEGRDRKVLDDLAAAAGDDLLDVHSDAFHHRSVFTMIGESAPRRLAARAVERLDLRRHHGVHPRIGVVDVVPFIALADSDPADAIAARDRFCRWAGEELDLPCFRYGDERSLPDIRRTAFSRLAPDCGPGRPHPTAGACAVGARPLLIAYNLWVAGLNEADVRRIAAALRGPRLRTLGLVVGDRLQISCNLIAPLQLGPAEVAARVSAAVAAEGGAVEGAELVGLLPEAALAEISPAEWRWLDLRANRTIEARLRR